MISLSAVAVLLTGFGGLCTGFVFVTRLLVRSEIRSELRAEIANMHETFVPRVEADARDREFDRRLQVAGL